MYAAKIPILMARDKNPFFLVRVTKKAINGEIHAKDRPPFNIGPAVNRIGHHGRNIIGDQHANAKGKDIGHGKFCAFAV